jgi:hypothetical protein
MFVACGFCGAPHPWASATGSRLWGVVSSPSLLRMGLSTPGLMTFPQVQSVVKRRKNASQFVPHLNKMTDENQLRISITD